MNAVDTFNGIILTPREGVVLKHTKIKHAVLIMVDKRAKRYTAGYRNALFSCHCLKTLQL